MFIVYVKCVIFIAGVWGICVVLEADMHLKSLTKKLIQFSKLKKCHDLNTEATLLNEAGLAPAPRVEADIGEAEAMYEAALGLSQMPQNRQPISLFDLLKVSIFLKFFVMVSLVPFSIFCLLKIW